MINTIIIDDEKNSADYLKNILQDKFENINIISIIDNTSEAYNKINLLKPNLIFLDIELPNQSGIEMLKMFDNINFEIIFVTAHANYAIEAFEFCAIGYIIKPASVKKIALAIENAKNRIKLKQFKERATLLLNNLENPTDSQNSICIYSNHGMTFVKIHEIIRCEGISKATKIIIKDKNPIFSSYSIGRFVKLLKPYDFLVLHKSHIVNKKYIVSYNKDGYITLTNDEKVPVAKRRKQEILKIMGR